MENEKLIEDILRHLDKETQMGVVRMSVEMDEEKSIHGEVSHKCCNMYGPPMRRWGFWTVTRIGTRDGRTMSVWRKKEKAAKRNRPKGG